MYSFEKGGTALWLSRTRPRRKRIFWLRILADSLRGVDSEKGWSMWSFLKPEGGGARRGSNKFPDNEI